MSFKKENHILLNSNKYIAASKYRYTLIQKRKYFCIPYKYILLLHHNYLYIKLKPQITI